MTTVSFMSVNEQGFIETSTDREFEVRHFINKGPSYVDGKFRNGGYGGKTLLVINGIKDNSRPMIIWSYCRPTEQYSRLSGLLTAFQKYLDLNIPGHTIIEYHRPNRSYPEKFFIYFKKMADLLPTDSQPYFWLKA